MRKSFLIALAVAATATATTSRAGGPPPMYVVVEKVVLEPNDAEPKAVKIFGWFTRLRTPGRTDEFIKPVHGYIYLGEGCAEDAPKWKKAAGTGKAVTVGACHEAKGFLKVPIRKASETVVKPDAAYPKDQLERYDDLFAGRSLLELPEVKALLAAAKADVKEVDGATMSRFISDAIMAGLTEDGVPREFAARIARNPDFLGKCSLCAPTHEAIVNYSKLTTQPAGKGLKEDLRVRLASAETQTRHEALRELVQIYMERAYAKSKMSDEERAAMRATIAKHRPQKGLGLPNGQKFCPSCDGASCVLPR